MITINSHDYLRSAELFARQLVAADRLFVELCDSRQSLDKRADYLAGVRCSRTIGRVIAAIKSASCFNAHHFLPALHAHQLALWFEGR